MPLDQSFNHPTMPIVHQKQLLTVNVNWSIQEALAAIAQPLRLGPKNAQWLWLGGNGVRKIYAAVKEVSVSHVL